MVWRWCGVVWRGAHCTALLQDASGLDAPPAAQRRSCLFAPGRSTLSLPPFVSEVAGGSFSSSRHSGSSSAVIRSRTTSADPPPPPADSISVSKAEIAVDIASASLPISTSASTRVDAATAAVAAAATSSPRLFDLLEDLTDEGGAAEVAAAAAAEADAGEGSVGWLISSKSAIAPPWSACK